LAPELKIPVASERSFLGKYSAVALIAIGKLPASPIASTARDSMKPAMDTGITARPSAPLTAAMPSPIGTENACMMAPVDQTAIAITYAALVPILSTNRPANSMEIAYTNWNTAAILA